MTYKFPVVCKDKVQHVDCYPDIVEYIKTRVPGSKFPDKLEELARFHYKNYGISDFQYLAENSPVVEKLAEIIKGKL